MVRMDDVTDLSAVAIQMDTTMDSQLMDMARTTTARWRVEGVMPDIGGRTTNKEYQSNVVIDHRIDLAEVLHQSGISILDLSLALWTRGDSMDCALHSEPVGYECISLRFRAFKRP